VKRVLVRASLAPDRIAVAANRPVTNSTLDGGRKTVDAVAADSALEGSDEMVERRRAFERVSM